MRMLRPFRNALADARLEAESAAVRKKIGQLKFYERKRKMREHMDSEHSFQLWHGDSRIESPVSISGAEARMRNKKFEAVFWKALDTNPKARLQQYRLAK